MVKLCHQIIDKYVQYTTIYDQKLGFIMVHPIKTWLTHGIFGTFCYI